VTLTASAPPNPLLPLGTFSTSGPDSRTTSWSLQMVRVVVALQTCMVLLPSPSMSIARLSHALYPAVLCVLGCAFRFSTFVLFWNRATPPHGDWALSAAVAAAIRGQRRLGRRDTTNCAWVVWCSGVQLDPCSCLVFHWQVARCLRAACVQRPSKKMQTRSIRVPHCACRYQAALRVGGAYRKKLIMVRTPVPPPTRT
jgi:hypothetical protein